MQMKKFFMCGLLIFLAGVCFGQNTLIVVPLQNRGGIELQSDVETITGLLGNGITKTGRFSVLDGPALDNRMRDLRLRLEDWAVDDDAIQMAYLMGASFVVRGQVSRLGSNLIVTSRLLDVGTHQYIGAAEMQLENTGEAWGKMDGFVRELLVQFLGAAPARREGSTAIRTSQGSDEEWNHSYSEQDSWKHRAVYMGMLNGGGATNWNYRPNNTNGTNSIIASVFYFEWNLLPFFQLEIDLGIATDLVEGDIYPVIPMMGKIGGKIGSGFEISGNLGFTPVFGFTVGGSVGFRVGGPCLLFLEVLAFPSYDYQDSYGSIFVIALGFKAGIGFKR